MRPDLLRGHEGDGELVWKEVDVANGEVKKAADEKVKVKANDKVALDGGPCIKCADTANEMTTEIIHSERKIGPWHRTFTLPLDCDLATTKAKLEAGLLHISVFKKDICVGNEAKMVGVE